MKNLDEQIPEKDIFASNFSRYITGIMTDVNKANAVKGIRIDYTQLRTYSCS